MKRARAIELVEELLATLDAKQDDRPLSLVTEIHLFGSLARGALEPGDVDINVNHGTDFEWGVDFATALRYRRSPYTDMKRMLIGSRRSVQLMFNSLDDAGPEQTLLWQRGDTLTEACARLHAIPVDAAAGRAPREAMIPAFDGLDQWIPLYFREHITRAIDNNALKAEQIQLTDGNVQDPQAARHIRRRWNDNSPLRRAANAAVAHLESRGLDPLSCHLHGRDVEHRETPYYVSFQLRYLRSLPYCFTKHGGTEWIEILHPTRTGPIRALRFTPSSNTSHLAEVGFFT